jgi:hypothetical protein
VAEEIMRRKSMTVFNCDFLMDMPQLVASLKKAKASMRTVSVPFEGIFTSEL